MTKHRALVFALTAAVLGLAACDTRYDFSLRPPRARAWPQSGALHAAPATATATASRAAPPASTTHN